MTNKKKREWIQEELRNREEAFEECDKEFNRSSDALEILKETGYSRSHVSFGRAKAAHQDLRIRHMQLQKDIVDLNRILRNL